MPKIHVLNVIQTVQNSIQWNDLSLPSHFISFFLCQPLNSFFCVFQEIFYACRNSDMCRYISASEHH